MITLASSVRWTSGNPAIYLTYAYEKRRSGADMQYRAQITVSTVTGASSFGYPIYTTVTINGAAAGSATIKAASPSQWSSALTYTTPWVTVSNKTTGTTPISFRVYSGSGSSRNQTNSYSMAVDPAASLVSASNGTLGTAQTITLTKYESSFTSTITYTCGNVTGTIATKTTASSVSFTPPVSLAAQNTTGANVAITITATTYTSAGAEVGSNSVVISAAIPASVKPAASIAISDSTSNYSKYGAYVQGQSALSITLTGTPAQAAPISKYFISADGKTFSTQTASVAPISGSGTLTISGYVTDTRGRQSDPVSRDIMVLPYTAPKIDSVSMQRCDADGTQNHLGSYIKVTFTASVSALSNKNTARYVLQYKPQTSSSWTSVTLSSYTNQYSVSNGSYIFSATADTGYNVQLAVTDDFKTSTRTAQAATGEVTMHFLATKDGGAFGRYADTKNLLDVNWSMRVRGDLTVDGQINAELLKKIALAVMPVGYVYISFESTSPAALFGGTWTQIGGRFLLAADDTYAAGSTGGEATHALTVDEMPAHRHGNIQSSLGQILSSNYGTGATGRGGVSTNVGNSDYPYFTGNTGGDQPHNNMPPYISVYMWRRTA